uniref:Uncharacterized protein n=1 Tax=Klebsiella pneumoniae subsp. pneumoniae TaxID=72407 RepID=A0A6G8F4Y6_KLEPN|nr:hypothetical protein [Klebsiella pneumoniae subsp. pneumoniae]QIM11407.1 hypothetical protein [Klebsiella pneumoniae subsp. pneumoniae]
MFMTFEVRIMTYEVRSKSLAAQFISKKKFRSCLAHSGN